MPKTQSTAKEAWELMDGLADDVDIWIKSSSFGYRDNYQSGQAPLLIWEVDSPDTDDITSVIFPIGKGWEVIEAGAKTVHEKRDRFIKTSLYGKLISRVTSDLKVDMSKRGTPREAAVWNGMGFHMKREEIEYGGEILADKGGKTTHLMPIAFLGFSKPVGGGKTALAVAPEGESAHVVVPISLTEKKLAIMAKVAATLEEFQSKALDMADVSGNDKLLAEVLDEGPSGFYATHHK